MAVRVMRESGIDITAQKSKGLDAVPLNGVDHIITLCGDAEERCPTLPLQVKRSHWPLADPARAVGDEQQRLNVFREVRDEIQRRVRELFPQP